MLCYMETVTYVQSDSNVRSSLMDSNIMTDLLLQKQYKHRQFELFQHIDMSHDYLLRIDRFT